MSVFLSNMNWILFAKHFLCSLALIFPANVHFFKQLMLGIGIYCTLFFFAILEFELRHSTTWASPPTFCAFLQRNLDLPFLCLKHCNYLTIKGLAWKCLSLLCLLLFLICFGGDEVAFRQISLISFRIAGLFRLLISS
jgi:hypothetical protein